MKSILITSILLITCISLFAQKESAMVLFQGKIVPVSDLPPRINKDPLFTDEVELTIEEGGTTATDYTQLNFENPANTYDWAWMVSSSSGNMFLSSPLGSDGITFTQEQPITIKTRVDELQTLSDLTVGSSGSQGELEVMDLSVAGLSTSICIDASGPSKLGRCASSKKYKTDIRDLSIGLADILKLHPVEFDWTVGDTGHDLGFIAEETVKVHPLLATTDEKGNVTGVKYRRMTAALAQAIKDMKDLIDSQDREIERLHSRIEVLEKARLADGQ